MSNPATTGPLDVALRARITNHFIRAVLSSPLETQPFPHIVVRNVFPEDVYQQLLLNLPDDSLLEAFDYEKHHQADGHSNRKRFQMSNAHLDRLPRDRQGLWWAVRGALGSPELKQAVFQTLAPGLAFRYGVSPVAAKDLPGFALPELFHETNGYRIAPHPDTRKKVVTMQIALPADNAHSHLGTEFYSRSLDPRSWLREPRGFEIAKRMPFERNTAYAFVVLNTFTLKSWHGRTTLGEQSVVRNSILNIWYAKAEHANLDLVREQISLGQLPDVLAKAA